VSNNKKIFSSSHGMDVIEVARIEVVVEKKNKKKK
jgi:phosphopantetheinyl transferase (holo-ACP synthase)